MNLIITINVRAAEGRFNYLIMYLISFLDNSINTLKN